MCILSTFTVLSQAIDTAIIGSEYVATVACILILSYLAAKLETFNPQLNLDKHFRSIFTCRKIRVITCCEYACVSELGSE